MKKGKVSADDQERFFNLNQDIHVHNRMNNNMMRRVHKIWMRNPDLFGDSKWIPLEQNEEYVLTPYFSNQFAENLQFIEDEKVIKLVNLSQIDPVYYSDILNAQFFISFDLDQAEIKKQDLKNQDGMYTFATVEEIRFKVKDDKNSANIYVCPQNESTFFLLKSIKL